jgi:peroxiredoxin
MALALGDPAPDFRVALPGERTTALAAYRGQPLVLIFTRHLA